MEIGAEQDLLDVDDVPSMTARWLEQGKERDRGLANTKQSAQGPGQMRWHGFSKKKAIRTGSVDPDKGVGVAEENERGWELLISPYLTLFGNGPITSRSGIFGRPSPWKDGGVMLTQIPAG